MKNGEDIYPIAGRQFQTDVIGAAQSDRKGQKNLLKKASWAHSKQPTGSLHDLGIFKKDLGKATSFASKDMAQLMGQN